MNGIKMSDCKFYVDKDARTVVCVIPNTRNLVIEFIIDNFEFEDIDLTASMWNKFSKSLYMPRSFMGKAVCAEEDEWNEETGRLIAYSRAKDKCYKSFFKRANHYVQTIDKRLNDVVNTFNDFGTKLEDKRVAIGQQIDELTGK